MSVTNVVAPEIGRVRAYFAPVNRVQRTATLFDPGQMASFDLDAPPAPWIDLGWIREFTRHSGTVIAPVSTGAPQSTSVQVRTRLEAQVAFRFEGWGKLQLALASGVQQMNVLQVQQGAKAAPSGGVAIAAAPVLAGSTASTLQVGAPAAAGFQAGQLVAVDVDCLASTTGFVGSGVSGAYLKSPLTDVDYVRRVTLNVARISSISSQGALLLETPLLGGVPSAAMKVSGVVGFCDREGSRFFQEWSALFVAEGQQGERVLWHYPRLQASEGIAEQSVASQGGYLALQLKAAFRALPVTDAIDGEQVLCFRSYITP